MVYPSQLFDKVFFSLATTDIQKKRYVLPVNPAVQHSFSSQQVQRETEAAFLNMLL